MDYNEMFNQRLARDNYYKGLLLKYSTAVNKRHFVDASSLRAKLEQYKQDAIKKFIAEKSNEYISLRELEKRFSKDDGAKFRNRLDTMCFCLEIINTCFYDIDDILKRLDDTLRIEAFGALKDMRKEVNTLLHEFDFRDDMAMEQLWADTMDKLEELVFDRARVYHNKAEKLANKLNTKKNGN